LRIASLLPPEISASSASSDAAAVRGVPAKATSVDAVDAVDAVCVTPIVIEASRVLEKDITDVREERV
jgi:hypothetical protein